MCLGGWEFIIPAKEQNSSCLPKLVSFFVALGAIERKRCVFGECNRRSRGEKSAVRFINHIYQSLTNRSNLTSNDGGKVVLRLIGASVWEEV